MIDDRMTSIKVGDKEHKLLLSTGASQKIMTEFGGLSELGEQLSDAKNADEATKLVKKIILILNESATRAENLMYPSHNVSPLTEEELDYLTAPGDLLTFQEAIMGALTKGSKRNVLSEEDETENTPDESVKN